MNRLILDTETLGNVNKKGEVRVYDFACVVVSNDFSIVETYRRLNADKFFLPDMKSAYYASKLPSYYDALSSGKLQADSFLTIWSEFNALVKKHNVKEIWAYNARFDIDALNATIAEASNGFRKYFFPYGAKLYCIQHVASQTMLNTVPYFRFCVKNGFVSDKGNLKTTAESAYAYITKNPTYKEDHTALQDSIIESQILAYCKRNAKAWRKVEKEPNAQAWRKPQKKFKEFLNK